MAADLFRNMLRTPVFLDSSALDDLRKLFNEGIAESDTVVLLLTEGVLTRPWCLLELLEATRRKVPIVPVVIANKGWDAAAMRKYIDSLEQELGFANPAGLQLLHEQLGDDLGELQLAIGNELSMPCLMPYS